MKQLFFLILLASANVLLAADNPQLVFRSPESRATLLELYTSEGCSSCPPAEAWLSKVKSSPALWREFVPVAFHVDYWDYLGWRDPWAKPEFTARQHAYAQAWCANNVYTPGFVLNGKEWRNWGGGAEKLNTATTKPGVLELSSADTNRWQVRFTPVVKSAARLEACVALLGSGLVSDVKAGENRGRKLAHDFVVLSLARVAMTQKDGVWQGEAALPSGAAKTQGSFAVAAWVLAERGLEPVQAVGGWLKAP